MDDRKIDNKNNIEEKEQINKDTSNNIDNKNINKDDKEENKYFIDDKTYEEEIDALFKEIFEKMEKNNEIKMVNGKPKLSLKTRLIDLCRPLFGFVILIALTGFIKWINYDKFYIAVIAMFIIAVIDYISELIIKKYFFVQAIKSFGSLYLLPPVISFVLVCVFFPYLQFPSIGLVLLVMVIFIVVKKFFFSTINKIIISRRGV